MTDNSLHEQADSFASDVSALLVESLPNAPQAEARVRGNRLVVGPEADVPLFANGRQLASLKVRYRCELDSRGTWLAIEGSSIDLLATLDRTPILRFDYNRSPVTAQPGAHLQVHAHRGALSHLLSQAGHPHAHDMSKLHIPVGGSRFRPSLEDVVELIAVELRLDALDTWREAVNRGRERWRRTQTRAVVRDFPEEAAAVLRELGFAVTDPAPFPQGSDKARHRW